jgi:hypothetical protein
LSQLFRHLFEQSELLLQRLMLCLRLMQHLSLRLRRLSLKLLRWWLKWTLLRLKWLLRLYEFLQYFDTQAQCLLRFRLRLEPSERRLLQFQHLLQQFLLPIELLVRQSLRLQLHRPQSEYWFQWSMLFHWFGKSRFVT